MSFIDAEGEIRGRFAESLLLTNHLRLIAPTEFVPLDDLQKSMRGLLLVSIYAAFERSVNAVVEAAIQEVSNVAPPSIDCISTMHVMTHYSKIQSIRDSGAGKLIDNSIALFAASLGRERVSIQNNPIADRLQNVDGSTLQWVANLFGVENFEIELSTLARLRTLRERRNAVAHGREAASKVGERYSLNELANTYDAADREATHFLIALRQQCLSKQYMRKVA